MSGMLDLDGFLMRWLTKVGSVIMLNILWVVCCVPVVTAGASTAAMCGAMIELLRNENYNTWKDYWKTFRATFWKATLLWVMLVVMLLLWGADLFICLRLVKDAALTGVLLGVFVLFSVLTLGIALYMFPYLACFRSSVKETLQNAALLSLENMLWTLVMLIADGALFTVTILYVQPMFLFAGILVALINCTILKKIFQPLFEEKRIVENHNEQ